MIRLVDILSEKRRNPSKNIKVSILDKLERYHKDKSYFVSFTDIEKIGINPINRFSTPIGIYVYSLKDLWNDWVSGDYFFGKDRPYVNLIKLNTSNVLHINKYKFNKKDLKTLESVYNKNVRNGISFDNFIKDVKSGSSKNSLYKVNTDGGLLWNITQELSKLVKGNSTKSYTAFWNKLFTDMGYEVIVDRSSNIHLLQSSQAVFLRTSAFKLIGRYVNKIYEPQVNPSDDYWGTETQPFYRPGPNPTIDGVIIYDDGDTKRVLLIKRGGTSGVEVGKWALPGGFHDTNSPKGEPWKKGRETARKALVRELTEETGLYLGGVSGIYDRIKYVGTYEGSGRDPRDNKEAWSKSVAFVVVLTPDDNIDINKVQGRDDAAAAKWVKLNKVNNLAFDHDKILKDAMRKI